MRRAFRALLFRTFKKSTALYKVHNIRLRYIKLVMSPVHKISNVSALNVQYFEYCAFEEMMTSRQHIHKVKKKMVISTGVLTSTLLICFSVPNFDIPSKVAKSGVKKVLNSHSSSGRFIRCFHQHRTLQILLLHVGYI